jgi:hypothetical protein
MSACATCNCSPCQCQSCGPTFLNQPRIINPNVSGGIFAGGVFNAPTINGGTTNGQSIIGATIDCTTLGCTQPQGSCDSTLATTAFVCGAISDAISGLNPNFCTAVQICLAGSPTLCTEIITCINTTPGSINNIIAFDPSVFATTLQVGVIRIATLPEVQGASCGLAIDPCTLEAFLLAGGPNPLWAALTTAVDSLITTSATLCAAVAACGTFAPLASPVFTGDPRAPTPAPGDNDTSIATTAFVVDAITTALIPYALLASPVFTGDPQAPTAALGDNDTSVATTAFVQSAIDAAAAPLFFSSATVGNLAATETDAYLHALAGGTLAADGDAIEFEASGTFTASASVDKRIRVYLGATIVFDSGMLAIITAESWHLRGSIVRTGAAAEKVAATLTTSDGTIQAIAGYSTAAENLAVGQGIKLTLNGTLANDVVAELYRDRFVSA